MAGAGAHTTPSPHKQVGASPREVYLKLAVAILVTWTLILIAGFLYSDQADRYSEPYIVAVLLQIVYETPFQPLFLVIVLAPIYVGAARNLPWPTLATVGLMMVSVIQPYARFNNLDTSGVVGADPVLSVHNSLIQLAGPGHQMPQFVSVVTLLMMGGITAIFWQARIGALIGLMGLISMAFVWNAAYHDPATLGGPASIQFLDSNLQYGYYLAWVGAAIGIVGQWHLLPWPRGATSSPEGAS